MLKKRVIPALLIKDNLLVKTKKFKSPRSIGSIIEAVKLYDLREVDELVLLDISNIKKNNELIYIEIDKNTFNLLQSRSNTIAWDLYTPLSTLWYIKGNKEQIYKANKGLISLIEQNQKWYGFSKYLKEDFLKYYLES